MNTHFSTETWPSIVPQLNLKGITLTLANQAIIGKMINNRLELTLPENYRSLCNEKQQQLLREALTQYAGNPLELDFRFVNQTNGATQTPKQPEKTVKQEANMEFEQDANLMQLLEMFDAEIHKTTEKKGT